MRVADTADAQWARLTRTLLAVVGGVALSLVVCLLYLRGSTRLNATGISALMAAFWTVNLGFVLAILSNLNLRLKDPSMTVAQMLWATISTFALAYFVTDGRHLLLMIYLVAMIFGSFRLNMAQHLLVAMTALALYGIVIAGSARAVPGAFDLSAEILNWSVFLVVLLGFSVLGGEASRLRAALTRRNRELRSAHDATALAFAAKSRFLASTSHELRTPLNTMLGATDVVESANLDADQRDALVRSRNAGKHLLSLVNFMIDLSRIETGVLELRTHAMDLCEELDSLHGMMAPDAASRGVALQMEKHGLAEHPVVGDSMRIQEVLIQLLKLAIDAPRVTVVRIRARRRAPDDAVRFTVWANGHIADISSADSGNADIHRSQRSFGLDLCHKLIELMGGVLRIPEAGVDETCFEFDLNMPPGQSPAEQLSTQRHGKILIVDDSIDNRILLQAYLKDQPWELHFAEDGVAAVEEFSQREFDIVLMDMHMPRMNGLDATRAIRKMEHEQPHRIPAAILAITADDTVNDHQRSLAAGCDEHLVKPVAKRTLLTLIAQLSTGRL